MEEMRTITLLEAIEEGYRIDMSWCQPRFVTVGDKRIVWQTNTKDYYHLIDDDGDIIQGWDPDELPESLKDMFDDEATSGICNDCPYKHDCEALDEETYEALLR